MNCKLCKHKKLVSVVCTADDSKMCEGCSKEHVLNVGHEKFLMKYSDWFKKQHEAEIVKTQVALSIKNMIRSDIDLLPKTYESLLTSLEKRKEKVKEMITAICEEQISRAHINRDFAKYQFEKNFHALYSKSPSTSGLSHIIANFSEEDELEKITFSEVLKPVPSLDLTGNLADSFGFSLAIYPNAKPISIPFIHQNKVFWYDCLHKTSQILELPQKKLRMYYAQCFLPNFDVFFSGGCNKGEVSADVFSLQVNSLNMESYPSMILERYMHAMIEADGWIYVFGGVCNSGNTNKCEKYKFGASAWEDLGELKSAKVKPTVCRVNQKIFIGDENDIEVYNTADNTFTVLSVFKENKYMIMAEMNSKILIFRKNSLYEVTLEPTFVTRELAKVPILEYSSLTQPILLSNVIYFVLDVDKFLYSYDLQSHCLNKITPVT